MTFLGTTVWEGAQLMAWSCPECEDQWVWDARRGWQNMEEAPDAVARPAGDKLYGPGGALR